jgi:iron complex transport system substrate-binding protein
MGSCHFSCDVDRIRLAVRMNSWRLFAGAAILGSSVGLGSSPTGAGPVRSNVIKGCVERFDPTTDYFPDKLTVEDAANFSVSYHRSYKVVTVRQASTGGTQETYVLVQCGTPPPKLDGELSGAQVGTVPVTSLFSASTTHLSFLVDFGRLDVLTGVSRLKDLIGEAVLARGRTGLVREFAPISVVDSELVVSSRPGLVMTGAPPTAQLAVIRSAGIPVVANTEWLEPTALARAEWIKYVGLFLNEEQQAQRLYAATKDRYRALSARATSVPDSSRPSVMTGRGTRGDFVIAGGRSYVAALIRDAGGRYVWADNTAVGAPTVDLETQLRRALEADIWINGGGWKDLTSMIEEEPRYAQFKAYRQKQVWVYERRATPAGGNDYWSRSVSHPDLVLADLIKIFHPTLLPDRSFEWYMQLPGRTP